MAQRVGKLGTGIDNGLFDIALTVEEVGHLLEGVGTVDLQIVDDGCLTGVLGRHDDALALAAASLDSNG